MKVINQPCGCRIQVYEGSNLDAEMIWCPLHEHALGLRDALRRCICALDVSSGVPSVDGALREARAAVAKAKGGAK